jgi:DNA-binding MarR family transcriptional regulator
MIMLDSLTLDQIRLFLAVADAGSFSKAARQLNRAQSAVTYGIQKLEAQFGIPLKIGDPQDAIRRLLKEVKGLK